jgi:hypothetical protein
MADVVNTDLISRAALWTLGINNALPNLELRLFVNNITVTCETVLGDFVQCFAPGYNNVALVPGNWDGSTADCVANYAYPQITFTFTGQGDPPNIVYGHYLVDVDTDDIWWAQNWTTPFEIPEGGGTAKVTLTWSDHECS